MDVTIDSLSPVKKKLTIVIPAARIKEELDKEYVALRKQVRIKGFRPGKAPRSYFERIYGKEVEGRVIYKLINDVYSESLVENKLEPVGEPEVESGELAPGEDYHFSASFEVKPIFEPVGYKGLKLTKEVVEVTDALVDAELEKIRARKAVLEPVEDDRPVITGDIVVIDYKGYEDAVAIEGLQYTDAMYEAGAAKPIPGFGVQLVGLKKGEERDIDVVFPADFPNERFAGKKAMMVTKVKEIKKRTVPELDDEFAQSLGEIKDLAELKKNIRTELEMSDLRRANIALEDQIRQIARDANQISLPSGLIENMATGMRRNTEMAMLRQGIDPKQLGADDSQTESYYQERAKKLVHWLLVMEKIARTEKITVEKEEIEAEYQYFSTIYNISAEKARKVKDADEIGQELLERKVFEFVLANSEIDEKKVAELSGAKSDSPIELAE